MNRNTLTGFILIALVLILFSWWSQPSQEEIDAYNRQQDSIAAALANAEKQKKEAEQQHEQQAAAAALGDTTSLFYSALNGQDQALTLKNGKVELTVNTKGESTSGGKSRHVCLEDDFRHEWRALYPDAVNMPLYRCSVIVVETQRTFALKRDKHLVIELFVHLHAETRLDTPRTCRQRI